MTYETIRYEFARSLARITLDRPDRLNALNATMRRELRHALRRAGEEEARAVLLTGEGRAFCAGQDLGEARTLAEIDLEGVLREEYEPLIRAVAELPAPVLCAVNGAAAGAGANLALSCDVVIAARSARFTQAFSRIGLIPDSGGTYWLPRLVGLPRAMGMCLFAEPIPAEQARSWGLIWEVAEDSELPARAEELARRLAEGPTAAFARAKRALRESLDNTLAAQLSLEATLQGEAGRTRDFLEGVTAFLDKREPEFEGR